MEERPEQSAVLNLRRVKIQAPILNRPQERADRGAFAIRETAEAIFGLYRSAW